MSRLLIVDSMNDFIRCYSATPTISTNGLHIGGITGFLRSFQKNIREFKPDKVVFCWDGAGGSLRKRSVYKEYKEGRKPPKLNRFINTLTEKEEGENKLWQIIRLTEYLEDFPVYSFMIDGVEADDIIAYVARMETFASWQKCIVSSDKDFIQLLDSKTVIYRPVSKVIWNTRSILDEFGIHPNNFCVARSISGDKSDNVGNVKGVGLKTVAKRFPFLKEEKTYYIADVEKCCRQQISSNAKCKAYTDILNSIETIKRNYSIIQLFSPMISIQEKDKIRHELNNKKIELHQARFQGRMLQDGFDIDFEFDTLFQWGRKIVELQQD